MDSSILVQKLWNPRPDASSHVRELAPLRNRPGGGLVARVQLQGLECRAGAHMLGC